MTSQNRKDKSESMDANEFCALMVKLGVKYMLEKNIIEKKFNPDSEFIAPWIYEAVELTSVEFKNRSYWLIKPKDNVSDKILYYIHGGAYILNISKGDWEMIATIAMQTRQICIIPNYGLAPDFGPDEVYEFIYDLYVKIIEDYKPSIINIIGDSAGATLAFGFSMMLRDKKFSLQPKNIILLSPWLDVALRNPDVKNYDEGDVILDSHGCKLCGKTFIKDLDDKDYRVSPLFGDFSNLGKLTIFIGTKEIFYPDCEKLHKILTEQNIEHNYYPYPDMFHVWQICVRMKEGIESINQIVDILTH